jgi:hypothetical protein
MEDFSITTRLTGKEYSKVMFIGLYKKPRIIVLTILGVVLLLGGLKIIPFYSDDPYLEIIIGLYFLLISPIAVLRTLKQLRSDPMFLDEITYTFGEGGFIIQGTAFRSEIEWAYIMKQKEINKFLILYHTKARGNYIDKTKLTNEQLQFIKAKVKNTRLSAVQ